jgi:3,4-dihydroxy 2-butanone 4-phosphate synthase/GTP cyclohydrolase II
MDSHHSLVASLEAVARARHGVILYIEQPDGGHDALGRLGQQLDGTKAVPASFRDYGIGAQILAALGLCKIRLLSGTTRRVVGLDGYGLEIVEQVPL